MYRSRVFLDDLKKRYLEEKLDMKVEIANLGDLKSKLVGFSNEVSDLVDLISSLDDEEIDKKLISSIESEYATIEKSVKSIGVAINNIISTLKKV